jgi:hypothetical protein
MTEHNPNAEPVVVTPVPDHAGRADKAAARLMGREPNAIYYYRDLYGPLLHAVARWDGVDSKQILPVSWVQHPDGREGWAFKHHPAPRPLYRLNRISALPHADIVVVEGEKSVQAAEKVFPRSAVTTSSGGANAAKWQTGHYLLDDEGL